MLTSLCSTLPLLARRRKQGSLPCINTLVMFARPAACDFGASLGLRGSHKLAVATACEQATAGLQLPLLCDFGAKFSKVSKQPALGTLRQRLKACINAKQAVESF
jgi:hypothetical protein